MVVNRKVTGRSRAMAVGLGVGLAVSLVLTVIGVSIVVTLVLGDKLGQEAVGYASMGILMLSAALGAWLAAALVKRRWMIVCLGAGGSYYLTLLAITALFFGGQFQGMGVTALTVLGGCGCVGLLGLRGEKTGRKKVKKYRSG